MKQLYKDLWQTSLEHPFPGLNSHAYFLQREKDNVLFYNTSNHEELNKISDLGGISFQFLSHRHESGKSLSHIKTQFNSQLCASALEAPFIDEKTDIVISERQILSSNIEVIPTPGHTDGSLCFFYASPFGLKYLFTGDTLYRSNGQWGTLVFSGQGGSTESLIDSLSILRSLDPDVVICSAFVGKTAVVELTKDEWQQNIDSVINDLSS